MMFKMNFNMKTTVRFETTSQNNDSYQQESKASTNGAKNLNLSYQDVKNNGLHKIGVYARKLRKIGKFYLTIE